MSGMRGCFCRRDRTCLLAVSRQTDASLVERGYSTGVYPVIQRVLTPVSNLVPFALLDILAVAALCVPL